MVKEWPRWAKVLGVISILIFVTLTIYSTVIIIGISTNRYDQDSVLFFPVFILPIFFIIIIMWALGFLTHYLIKKQKYGIANAISIIGLLGILAGYVVFWLIRSDVLLQIKEFSFWTILQNIGFIASIVYFIVSLMIINKAKKDKNLNQQSL